MRLTLFILFVVSCTGFSQVSTALPAENFTISVLEQGNDRERFPNRISAETKDRKCGYINDQCEVVIPFIFDFAGPFQRTGIAIVEKDKLYGVIDTSGNYLIPMGCENVRNLKKTILLTYKDKQVSLLKTDMELIKVFKNIESISYDHVNEIIKLEKGEKFSYVYFSGKKAKPEDFKPDFSSINYGLYYSQNTELPGGGKVVAIYDSTWKEIRPRGEDFEKIYLAVLEKNKKYYFVKLDENYREQPRFGVWQLPFVIPAPRAINNIATSFTTAASWFVTENPIDVELSTTGATISLSIDYHSRGVGRCNWVFFPYTEIEGKLLDREAPIDVVQSRRDEPDSTFYIKYNEGMVGVQDEHANILIAPTLKTIIHLEKNWFFTTNTSGKSCFLNTQGDSLLLDEKKMPGYFKYYAGGSRGTEIISLGKNTSVLVTGPHSFFPNLKMGLSIKCFLNEEKSELLAYDSKENVSLVYSYPDGKVINRIAGELSMLKKTTSKRFILSTKRFYGRKALLDESLKTLTDFSYTSISTFNHSNPDDPIGMILFEKPRKRGYRLADEDGNWITKHWTTSSPLRKSQKIIVETTDDGINVYDLHGEIKGPTNMKEFDVIIARSEVDPISYKSFHGAYVETDTRSGMLNQNFEFINNFNYEVVDATMLNEVLVALIRTQNDIKIFLPEKNKYFTSDYDKIVPIHSLPHTKRRVNYKPREVMKWIREKSQTKYGYLLLQGEKILFLTVDENGQFVVSVNTSTLSEMPAELRQNLEW